MSGGKKGVFDKAIFYRNTFFLFLACFGSLFVQAEQFRDQVLEKEASPLKGLITSVASAGILDKLGVTGLTGTNVGILKEQMIRAGVDMGLAVTVQGKDVSEAFVSALQSCVGNSLQAMGAHALGLHRTEMGSIPHKLGHALLGAVGQGIATGTWEGAASGAVGACVGEMAAELLIDPAKVDVEIARLTPPFRASHPGVSSHEIRRMGLRGGPPKKEF